MTSRRICAFATVLVVLLQEDRTVLAGGSASGYFPDSCAGSSPCPSVSWSDYFPVSPGNFIVRSSTRSGSNNYISFAFSDSPNMEDAELVVDCYQLNGTITTGTSMNSVDENGTLSNDDTPASFDYLWNPAANVNAGVLTCSFTMNFPATSDVYVFLAEGAMSAVATDPPTKKQKHFAVYVSPGTVTSMSSLPTDSQSMNTAAVTKAAVAVKILASLITSAVGVALTALPSLRG